ncbi:hypothetical protein IM043_gp074 [Bacillus phage SPG24]|nr:hypothetical protein IM043_gp074 [Bacillus phage SPG24]
MFSFSQHLFRKKMIQGKLPCQYI